MLRFKLTGTRQQMLVALLKKDGTVANALYRTRLVPGSIAFHQGVALYLLAKQYDHGTARICNIGTGYGYSTALIARGAPQAHVVTLDPKGPRVEGAGKWLARYSNVEVVQARSWDYLAAYPQSQWDMVFVDGLHKQILRDVPWFNRLVPNGLFLSHDYVPWKYPYVVKALTALRESLGRPYDVSLIDNKKRGMVGLYRRKGEWWRGI